jgi:cell wall-associated NlpC family hydrolase
MDGLPLRIDPVPLSPTFPQAWTREIATAAYAHAVEQFPNEAAGVVEGGAYVPLDNASQSPEDDVHLSDADLIRVASAELFFHSHPNGHGCPSETDMLYQQQLGIPFVVMTLPVYDVFCFGEGLTRASLIGRGFRHGVHDCYSLIRDWYVERGITKLWDQPRGWEWWSKKQNLYMENFAAAGFERIDKAEATNAGDLVLFNFNYGVPMHGALVVDKDLLMHHASGAKPVDVTRLSTMVPRTRMIRLGSMALRHRDL